jgi:GT2 family glycosyltransferase
MTEVKQSAPLIYAIILTWNRRDEVLGAVRSLARLSYRNFVPIVVDNASEDDTIEVLRAAFPDVKILANNRNLGYTGGNNVGIRYALEQGAEYVMLLNNDARVHRFLIDRLLAVMQSDERIAVVGPKNLYEHNPDWIWGAWAEVSYGPMLTRIHGRNELDGPKFAGIRDVDQVIGCGYLWRRAALEDIGLLDTQFFGYHEDVDWCWRARRRAWRVVFCGDAIVYHKGGVSTDKRYRRAMPVMYFLGRNAILFTRKHGTGWDMARILLNSIRGSLSRSVRDGRGRITKREQEFLRGILDGLRGRNSQSAFHAD